MCPATLDLEEIIQRTMRFLKEEPHNDNRVGSDGKTDHIINQLILRGKTENV